MGKKIHPNRKRFLLPFTTKQKKIQKIDEPQNKGDENNNVEKNKNNETEQETYEEEDDSMYVENKNVKKLFNNPSCLSFLWSFRSKDGDTYVMQTLFGSYDLSKKKDSLSTVDYMRKRSQLRNVKMTVGRHVTFVTDRQNYFNTNVVDNFKNYLMFSPANLVKMFYLNIEVIDNEYRVFPERARKWFLYVNYNNYSYNNLQKLSKNYPSIRGSGKGVTSQYLKDALEEKTKIKLSYDKPISETYELLKNNGVVYYLHYKNSSVNDKKQYVATVNEKMVFFDMVKENYRQWLSRLKYITTYNSLFYSNKPTVLIPYFQSLEQLDVVKKIIYYYQIKSKEFNIPLYSGNNKCAEEIFDKLYDNYIGDGKKKYFFQKPETILTRDKFLKEWEKQYKFEGNYKSNEEDLKKESKMKKKIIKKLRKIQFAEMFNHYYNSKENVPLHKIIQYFN